jgi:Fic family protein
MTAAPDSPRQGRAIETVVGGEIVRAFVPAPLPPNPPVDVPGLPPRLIAAERALGRLDGITFPPPRPDLVLYMYVRKEAVLSSQKDVGSTQPPIRAALQHVQFESIHPFLDGNGRIGRLPATMLLCVRGVLRQPLLYISLFLNTNRAEYCRPPRAARESGAWEAWLAFFLDGVAATANQAFEAAIRIVDLFKTDRERISARGDHSGSAPRPHEGLRRPPFASAPILVERAGLSAPTVNAAPADPRRLDIVQEVTGRKRDRVFGHGAYLAILNEGAEPLATTPAPP